MKRALLIISLVSFTATSALAATGKVKSVSDDKIVVDITDAGKLKKGSSVKVNSTAGKITSVEGNSFTIKSKKAAEFKAGDQVTVEKVNEMQGC